jgi:hypothetical protein
MTLMMASSPNVCYHGVACELECVFRDTPKARAMQSKRQDYLIVISILGARVGTMHLDSAYTLDFSTSISLSRTTLAFRRRSNWLAIYHNLHSPLC